MLWNRHHFGKSFRGNMRQLIANAFDGFMSPQINNLADQSAMVYYQAVYLSRENDANSMTCILSQRGLALMLTNN